MRKLKILAISYAFPPMAFPQSIMVSHIIANLDASIVVVCGDDEQARYDETIAPGIENLENLEHIIRVPFHRYEFLQFLDRQASRFHLSWSNVTDPQRKWIKDAGHRLLEWQKKSVYKPDLILTFGMPMSDHIFGLEYKKQTGVPWAAHFSDPWTDNLHDKNPLSAWLNKRMERQVIERADRVIFTTPETLDLVMKKYPASWCDKACYVPHFYDGKLHDDSLKPPKGRYIIRSIGNFYDRRSPKPFFEAIEAVAQEKPGLLDGVSIEFIGSLGIHKDLLARYPVAQGLIRLVGMVPYAESLRLMQTAHCLLVIDAPADLSVFFPSKLVEYIGANRFILAISPPGATARIVKEVGGALANPSSIDTIVHELRNVLEQRPDKLPLSTNCYDRKSVVDEFMKIIDKYNVQKPN